MSRFQTLRCVRSCAKGAVFAGSILLAMGSAHAMTIKDSVEMALAKNPDVLSVREQLKSAEARSGAAVSAVFPVISLDATASHRRDAQNQYGLVAFGGEPFNQYLAQLKGIQPIYRGGMLLAGVSATNADVRMQALNVAIAERDLSLKVMESFYDVLVAQTKIASLQEAVTVETEALKVSEKRERTGRSQRLDVLQSKTQLALLQPRISQAKTEIELAASTLASVMGDFTVRELKLNGSLEPIPDSSVQAVLKRYEQKLPPEIERSEKSVEKATSLRTIGMAKHLPTVDVVANYGRTTFRKIDLINNYLTSWSFGLQISIPIFSGLSSFRDRADWAAQMGQAEIERTRVQSQASLNEIQAKKNYELTQAVAISSKAAYELARESLKEARKNYKLSMIDHTQYLSSQQSFLEAEIAYRKAQRDALVATARLLASVGVPMNEFYQLIEKRG